MVGLFRWSSELVLLRAMSQLGQALFLAWMEADVDVRGLKVERRHEMTARGVLQERVQVRAELSFPLQEALGEHRLEAFDIHVTAPIYERLQFVFPLLCHFLGEPDSFEYRLLLVAEGEAAICLVTWKAERRLLDRGHDVSELEWRVLEYPLLLFVTSDWAVDVGEVSFELL